MTVDEAHRLVVGFSVAQASGRESFAHQALVDAFDRADAATQQKMVDACERLVLDGSAADQDLAGAFLETVPVSPDLLGRLVAQYQARGLDDSSAVAGVIGRKWTRLQPPDLKAIEQMFLAGPERQLTIGEALFFHVPDGPAWRVLMSLVTGSNDADTLGRAARAASAAEKLPEFYAAMKSKPATVKQATAERMTSATRDDYLRAVGLTAN